MKKFALLILLTLSSCAGLPAQTFSLNQGPQQMVSLDGLWRFHSGDDPHWADPNFDDSSWPLVHSDKSWPDQGMPVASGTFWYRASFVVPAGKGPLSLYIPSIAINYQVFVDGKLEGGQGAMPPHGRPVRTAAAVFPLSGGGNARARTAVIAIRAWRYPIWSLLYETGIEKGMLAGDSKLIEQTSLLNTLKLSWNSVSNIFMTLLEILAGMAALALLKARSKEQEYLWFGFAMLLSAVNDSITTYRVFRATDALNYNLLQTFFAYAIIYAFIAFYRRLMESQRDRLYWIAMASVSAAFAVNVVGFAPWVLAKLWLLKVWFPAIFILTVPYYVWLLALLIRKTMEGRIDALLLLLSNGPGLLDQYVGFRAYVGKPLFGWNPGSFEWYHQTMKWPFPSSIDNLSSLLLMLTMLAVLVHRFTRTSLQEEEHKREIEAARIVQQVLIPDAIPTIPGFALDAVYKPAGQVGGDFFQVLPIESGGMLVVVGDVSGKGMPAAMTVSLLVGTVRTLAHYTESPGEILAAMNQRMLGRTSGGFTTCFVMRVDPDGTLTVANAGHLAPYLRGHELEIEGGLPLGLVADSTYNEITFRLENRDQLTMVTDGVVEARDAKGELLGFDRTCAISTQSAEAIAAAAQQFGQEDDITVLTVARVERPQEATA